MAKINSQEEQNCFYRQAIFRKKYLQFSHFFRIFAVRKPLWVAKGKWQKAKDFKL